MATFSGEATVATGLEVDAASSRRHAARAQVKAAGDIVTPLPGFELEPSTNNGFELKAGDSIRIAWGFDSGQAVGTPTTGEVKVHLTLMADNSGTVVRTKEVLSLTGGWAQQTLHAGSETWFATSDGTATGTPKAGTYRIRVDMDYAQSTADATNGGYLSDSDGNYTRTGTPNTWDDALRTADKGYLRAGVDLTAIAVSNTLGAATPSPFAYPDKIRLRATSSAQALANSSSLVIDADTLTAADVLSRDLQINAASASTTWDDNDTNNKLTGTDPTTFGVQIGQPANSTLSSRPWTHFESAPAGWTLGANDGGVQTTKSVLMKRSAAFTLDANITVAHLCQVNEDDFATPPLSLDKSQILGNDLAFLSARFRNARGEGQNGITATYKNWDLGELTGSEASPVNTTSQDSGTQGGEAGWLDTAAGKLPLVWDESKPPGTWRAKVVITAPADAVGLETNATDDTVTLSKDPDLVIHVGFYVPMDEVGDHAHSGDTLTVIAAMERLSTGRRVAPDVGSAKVVLLRHDPVTDKLEFYDAAEDWVEWTTSNSVHEFTMTDNGASVFSRPFVTDSTWGNIDVLSVSVRFTVGGTPYQEHIPWELLSNTANPHDRYAFDGLSLVGFGSK